MRARRRSPPVAASLRLSDHLIMSYDVSTLHVRSHEGTRLEFKQSYESQKDSRYLKTLAAFSNNRGGSLVFGVSDSPRTIVGVNESTVPDIAEWQNKLRTHFDPSILVDIQEQTINTQPLVMVSVPQGERRPYICTRDATEVVRKGTKSLDRSILQEGIIYFRYAGTNLPIRASDMQEIIRNTVERDVKALYIEQARAELQVVALHSTKDGQKTNWQIVIRNHGPGETKNLRVRLLSIEPPSPKYWTGGYFPMT